MNIYENKSLKPYNTFGLEAKARMLVELETEDDIIDYLNTYGLKTDHTFILGGGSNVLFTRDFDGVVLKPALKGIEVTAEDDEYAWVTAFAGEEWDDLVQFCVERGFGGLENLSLIPGSVGAAPIQNIGAYGVEQKDHFYQLQAVSIRDQELKTFNREDCRFGYRDSIFKNEYKRKYIITSVTYKLKKNPELNTSYGSISAELKNMKVRQPSVKSIAKAVINIRNSKLPDPEEYGNAGSFFKNPVVDKEKHDQLRTKYPELVSFEVGEDQYKLAAGWLIEKCDWKGKSVGHASVHKKQALVLINLGKAHGSEILHLSRMIRMSVEQKFGIKLEYEVNIL